MADDTPVEKTESPWKNAKTINTDTLTGDLKKAYAKLVASRTAATKDREAFEAAATDALKRQGLVPGGKDPLFGYRFGKLAFIVVERKAKKVDQKAISLA